MFISRRLRKDNIAEYLLYMWQVEDIIRAYGCSLTTLRRDRSSTTMKVSGRNLPTGMVT